MMTAKMGEKDSKEEILKAFRLFDDDDTGKITFRNLKRVAKELGENMTDEELQEMIDEADRDGDGEINEDEFLKVRFRVVSSLVGPLVSFVLSYLSYVLLPSSHIIISSHPHPHHTVSSSTLHRS